MTSIPEQLPEGMDKRLRQEHFHESLNALIAVGRDLVNTQKEISKTLNYINQNIFSVSKAVENVERAILNDPRRI